MTPWIVSVPGDPGVQEIRPTVWPLTTRRQSYAVLGVRSTSPRLTSRMRLSSKPPGKEPVVQLWVGPRSAFTYQPTRSIVGLEIEGGSVPMEFAYTCVAGPQG